jgi:hypothetical protein
MRPEEERAFLAPFEEAAESGKQLTIANAGAKRAEIAGVARA